MNLQIHTKYCSMSVNKLIFTENCKYFLKYPSAHDQSVNLLCEWTEDAMKQKFVLNYKFQSPSRQIDINFLPPISL